MTKIYLQFKKSEFNSYTSNYKNALTNDVNATVIEEVDIAPIYVDCNKKVGRIQFNNTVLQNNSTQTFTVTENISIQFDDCKNSSMYAVNFYKTDNEDGSYESGKEYEFRIVSGTGAYVKSKGFITIKAEKDKRHVTVKLD
jgi:hypothetical protein